MLIKKFQAAYCFFYFTNEKFLYVFRLNIVYKLKMFFGRLRILKIRLMAAEKYNLPKLKSEAEQLGKTLSIENVIWTAADAHIHSGPWFKLQPS
jgi:hypothetical protein